eukprot:1921685-Pyramimonas_sp.AAC.1
MAASGLAATSPPKHAAATKGDAAPSSKKRPLPRGPAPESSKPRLARAPARPSPGVRRIYFSDPPTSTILL